MHDTTLGWRLVNPRMAELGVSTESMGETGENVAERYGISREDQDAFALRSHQRAVAAAEAGLLAEEIVPIEAPKGRETVLVEADEGPRPDASLEKLATLRPVFREGGTVTAGNASTLNDGAACLLIASEAGRREARRRAARPRRLLRRRRRRPRLHGDRPGRGRAQRPRRRRPRPRGDRPDRAQRGLRLPGPRLRPRARASTRSASTSTAARSPSATRSAAPAPASPAPSSASCAAATAATASRRCASASARAWRRSSSASEIASPRR